MRARANFGLALAIILAAGGLEIARHDFLAVANLNVLALTIAVSAVVAFAQMVVLGAGGMNLSVGATGGLSAVVAAGCMVHAHIPSVVAAALGVVVGVLAGCANGWLVAKTRVSPFLITLASGSAYTGITLGLTNANPILNLPKSFVTFGSARLLGITLEFYAMVAVAVLIALFFRYAGLGRQMLAMGSSLRAAELGGVPIQRTTVAVYGLSGGLSAVAGIMLAASVAQGDPSIGSSWVLSSFAAPIIGGTALLGGYVSVSGAVYGSLLLALVSDALVFVNVNTDWLEFFSGVIIILAMMLDRLRSKRTLVAAPEALTVSELTAGTPQLARTTGVRRKDELALSLRDISKRFGATLALDSVDFEVRAGEVHALLGENGAGKSTLIKIVSGVHQPDAGTYEVGGRKAVHRSPRAASLDGIAVVHQERALVRSFSVGENVLLAKVVNRALSVVRTREIERGATRFMAQIGLGISVSASVENLSPGQKQQIEIARALASDARILLLDEPTASLSQSEVERLATTVRALREQGVAIVYVTHKLEEVFALCDRVTVLRDGRNVSPALDVCDLTNERLIELMVGRVADEQVSISRSASSGQVVLEARDVRAPGAQIASSFKLHRGEVLGWYGLVGAGRTELARAVLGAERPVAGSVWLMGERIDGTQLAKVLSELGIGYVSENRQEEGLFLPHSVARNITATIWTRLRGRRPLLRVRTEAARAREFERTLGIKLASPSQEVSSLSGGNQQKVSVAKWLASAPTVLIFDEPTVGIDVRTKREIHDLIRDLAKRGTSVIVISSDLAEVIGLADRLLLFRAGGIVAEVENDREYLTMSGKVMQSLVGAAI